MVKRITAEEYLHRVKCKFGELYDYSKLNYTTSYNKIEIGCYTHGFFTTNPNTFTAGKGCPECQVTKRAKSSTFSTKEYLDKIDRDHKLNYDLSMVDYKHANSKIEVICRTHGTFSVRASAFARGTGCRLCAYELNTKRMSSNVDDFIARAKSVHGNRYDYSLVEYETALKNVEIICETHGIFHQTPASHLTGRGCPSCKKSGFKQNSIAHLYVLIYNEILKVGITNQDVLDRIQQINRSSGYSFVEVLSVSMYGAEAKQLERSALKYLASKYKRCKDKFTGSTECFYSVDILDLLNRIKENKWQA